MELKDQMMLTKQASRKIRTLSSPVKNKILADFADILLKNIPRILKENDKDFADAENSGMAEGMLDRLKLSGARIRQMVNGIQTVISLEDPVGKVLREDILKNGICLRKVSVPFGVVAIIFEARPNVAADCAALCLKSGNACLLKGGKEAYRTNLVIIDCMKEALRINHIDENAVNLTGMISHEETEILMQSKAYIDLLIPRGSSRLIQAVVQNAKVPVIETGAGVCHTYIDDSADMEMAERIVINAKCSRPSVCNAMETLLVHQSIAPAFLPIIIPDLKKHGVRIHGDEEVRKYDMDILLAGEEDWYVEYDSLEMNCRIVNNIEEAVNHIEKYGTHHSECIVSENRENVSYFMKAVDSACVYHNASTRFTDGFEFGLGAEIGISTQKLHARGPMGLNELTTYTYYLEGNGEIR